MGPLRETPGTPEASISLSHNLHWFSEPKVMGTSLPGTGTLGWEPGVALGLLALHEGTSTIEISLLIFNGHTWV